MTLYHLLKLFQSDTNAMLGKKTVVSEFYDEMVDFIMRGFLKPFGYGVGVRVQLWELFSPSTVDEAWQQTPSPAERSGPLLQ